MSQKFDHIDASEPVSTVTKHIKIYSDNPIHDCIDRIIDCAAWLDISSDNNQCSLELLREASIDLSEICLSQQLELINNRISEIHARKPN